MQYGAGASYGGDELGGAGMPLIQVLIASVFTIFTAVCAIVTGVSIVDSATVQTIKQVDAAVLTDIKIED